MARKEAGFTLIEAMTVLAITALTLTLGFPALSGALERTRVATTLHHLTADMAMARSTALMRREQVVVCPRVAGGSRCAPGSDWSHGWLVFVDADGNRQPDQDTDLLRATDAPARDRSLLYLPSTRAFLRYQVDGRSAHSNLSVNVCSRGLLAAKVVVNNHGRVRSERPRRETRCPRT
jgi:type IV fimbrial biogenesis protein FimT